jgi:hypothetical protein
MIPLPEPKPCPFCGVTGLTFADAENVGFRWGIAYCKGCGATRGDTRKHDDWHRDAINEWNVRIGERQYGDARAQEARAVALEEAAKVCEEFFELEAMGDRHACMDALTCSELIRALKGTT